MYLSYGNYSHGVGECQISINRASEYSESDVRWAIRETWNIQGLLTNVSGDLATMQNLIYALMQAYGVEGLDLVLHLPSGAATYHSLYSSNCLGGTKVTQPVSFPTGQGAEAITYRNYTLQVEGLIPVLEEELLSFSESISFSGGGPRYGHLETLIGLPVKQQLRNYTIYSATQSGRAVGLTHYPTMPGPIWPAALVERVAETRESPRRSGSDYYSYPITWSYKFEDKLPLVGNPTLW